MRTYTLSPGQTQSMPAYLSNGIIGLRVPKIPLPGGMATISGFVEAEPVLGVEAFAPTPYPLTMDLRINASWLSRRSEDTQFLSQRYDFANGELTSQFTFHAAGITARVEVLTFCSRSLPTIAAQEVRVTVDRPCTLTLRAMLDLGGVTGRCLEHQPGGAAADSLLWQSGDGTSTLGMAFSVDFSGPDGHLRPPAWDHLNDRTTDGAFEAQPGCEYSARMLCSVVPDVFHHQPRQQAIRMAYIAASRGFEALRAENRAAWAELWRGRVCILGADPHWQEVADAAFFYLHTSAHHAMPCGVSPFGLARWKNYHYFIGHVFWDAETFTLPPLLLTQPDAARAMLDYRFSHLAAARANAAMNGYKGVQFPWESSQRWGEEATPPGAGGVLHEHHISLDVAFAFAQYSHAAGDPIFTRERAWPVLHGVAEWITSRATRTTRGYEIHHVTGIDEGIGNVNNNAYLNLGSVIVLREAVDMAHRLGYPPPPRWQVVERGMVVPIIPGTNVINKNDGFENPGTGLCPDPLAAFFPLGYQASPQVTEATFRYYLENADGYTGYPMLSSLLGVYAARLGDRTRARHLFERGAASFLFDPYRVWDEYGNHFVGTKEQVGPYLANLGGFLMSCLYGLPGIQLNADAPVRWATHPVVMPEGWDSIAVERIWVHGQSAQLVARAGAERAEIIY